MMLNRRQVVSALAASAASVMWGVGGARVGRAANASEPLHVASNCYPWMTFYGRDQRDYDATLDQCLGEVADSGLDGFEPIFNGPEDVARYAPLLTKHGLQLRSFYMNSALHEPDRAQRSIDEILAVARPARDLGARIIVTNPSPIEWGGTANKNDPQLQTQAASLNRLGEKLRDLSLVLAYHNHDMELRCAAREFHHMMLGTDPALVTLCLDAHWIYRGSENSAVALFDVVKLYAPRVTELHIRQSRDNIWTESLGEGDIDYPRLVREMSAAGIAPHLVLEQAVEAGSPHTMTALQAHRAGCEYARRVFAPISTPQR